MRIRRMIYILSALCLILGAQMSVFAASSVTYDGDAKEFIFEPGSEKSPTDLFTDFKDVMPGDSFTQNILIKNHARSDNNAKIYLKSTGATAESAEFLSKLHLTVVNNEATTFFEGPAGEVGGLNDWVWIGTVSPGAEIYLDVTLSVPIELDDVYQDAEGHINWQFKVEEHPAGGGEYHPVPTQIPNPGSPAHPQSPQTGDTLGLGWYIVLALVSVLGIVATILVFVIKSREEEE